MPKPTPARIEYKDGKETRVIRFHAVLAEEHGASSEITKYPTQEGFQVSNHAIRHNRKVSIEAVISNVLLKDTNSAFVYSSNNSKTIFRELEDLINNRIECTVTTNLGVYYPVLFNRFSTKQSAGFVDSMKLVVSGEELQTARTRNKVGGAVVAKDLPNRSDEAIKEELAAVQIETCSNPIFKEGGFTMGEDFEIESVDPATGTVITTHYVSKGLDWTTGEYVYETHVTGQEVYEINIDGTSLGNECPSTLESGVNDLSQCLIDGAIDAAEQVAEDLIDTTMGELTKSIYGVMYEVNNMAGSDVGNALAGMASGCAVRGLTSGVQGAFGFDDTTSDDSIYNPSESLPTTNDILEGGKKLGNSLAGVDTSRDHQTITFIDCNPDPCEAELAFTGIDDGSGLGGYA